MGRVFAWGWTVFAGVMAIGMMDDGHTLSGIAFLV